MAFTTNLITLALLSTAAFAQYPITNPALGINPVAANPALTGYNPYMNSLNPALSGMNPFLGSGYGSNPLTTPYGSYGTNPFLSGLGLTAGLGLNGLNGYNPLTGLNGLNGLNGFNPISGLNGFNPLTGLNGLNGVNGLNNFGYPQGLGLNAGLGLGGFPNTPIGNPLLSAFNPYNRIPGLAY